MTVSLLVVDPNASARDATIASFAALPWIVRGASTVDEARRVSAEHAPDVILLAGPDGANAGDVLRADDPDVAILVLPHPSPNSERAPGQHDALIQTIEQAAAHARTAIERDILRTRLRTHELPAAPLAPSLDALVTLAAQQPDVPVLLQGERGTGKRYVARLIHERSARHRAPFVEVDCAAHSGPSFEQEVFGSERSSEPDARPSRRARPRRGLLEIADAGTLCLAEIAELETAMQTRLLHVFEHRAFHRQGGAITRPSHARIIVTTHVPLADAVADRAFRADLYYRLQILTLTLPPLRARPEEIRPLAHQVLAQRRTPAHTLTPAAEDALVEYRWPGNIRELENTLWRASILARGGTIDIIHLGLPGDAAALPSRAGVQARTLEETEREAIRVALRAANGNRSQAARTLGIARSTLLEKLKKYALG